MSQRNPLAPAGQFGVGKARSRIRQQTDRRTQLSRAAAEAITAEAELKGKTLPLDLMIRHMRYYEEKAEYWETEGEKIDPGASKYRTKRARLDAYRQRMEMIGLSVKFRALSQAAAVDAGPYMHAKIATVDEKNNARQGVTIILQGADARA